jgi:predicted PurR-regulated permease PerM
MRIRWQLWLGIVILLAFIYATRGILLPFVAGLAIAYLLDPLADRLEEWKFPRWLATAVILFLFFVGASGVVLAMLPIVQIQLFALAEHLPGYLEGLRPLVDSFLARINESFNVEIAADAESLLASIAAKGLDRMGGILAGLMSRGAALFNLLTLLLISPVVAFFLLRDWDLIVAKVDHWLPADQGKDIRMLAGRVDKALAGFVRGQTIVALTMAVLYAVGWSLVGLNYGLILGLLAGILAYVPFVGALVAMMIAMIVGLGQFGAESGPLLQVFGVFVVVQIIEGAFLTPRLIGSNVGLHPVWVLFAIFAGGEMMGFVGVLIALPVAAAAGVMVRYVVDRYLDSSLKKGKEPTGGA